MRITIEHRNLRRFSEPQARVIQLLRLTPGDSDQQSVVVWRIDIGCDARLRQSSDGYGNQVTMLYAAGPVPEIDLTVSGEVLTVPGSGAVSGTVETFPPVFYLRHLLSSREWNAARDLAEPLVRGEAGALAQMHRLNAWLHEHFRFDPDVEAAVDFAALAEALQGSAADAARLQIAAARVLGIPARFVSGYVAQEADGAPARPHGWTESWIEGLGWVGFDPMLGLCPTDRHVRVAIALDPAGAPRISESRTGGGDGESEVSLTVLASSGQA